MQGETGEAESTQRMGTDDSQQQTTERTSMVEQVNRLTPTLTWAYGVTTVPERKDTLLPRTLASLRSDGFDTPTLFVDGAKHGDIARNWMEYNLPVVTRAGRIKAFGNWILAMWELFLRNPTADRYVLFQDDLLAYPNLRQYLERIPYPLNGYLNLITQLMNEEFIKDKPVGFHESPWMATTPQRLQYGKGAVALVFDRPAVMALLSSNFLVRRAVDDNPKVKDRNVDGAIVTAMNYAGFREYIHSPSLVCHIGAVSTIRQGGDWSLSQPRTWRGESFNALDLLPSIHK